MDRIIEKMTFLTERRKCFIKDFILQIYQIIDGQYDDNTLNESFHLHGFQYKLDSDRSLERASTTTLQNYKERIALYNLEMKEGDGGTIHFNWENINYDYMKIEINYSITKDISIANKCEDLLFFLNRTIKDLKELEEHEKISDDLYRFFRPHINGINIELQRFSKPWIASYKKEKNGLKIFGIDQLAINEIARAHPHFDSKGELCLTVNLNNLVNINMIKKPQEEYWQPIDDIWDKISPHGKIELFIPLSELIHSKNLLSYKKTALYKLKDSDTFIGRNNLISLIKQDLNDELIFNHDLDIKKYEEFGYNPTYDYLDSSQCEVFKITPYKRVCTIFGGAGTGKTEIAAILAILYALNGKNVWITSETNTAVDNILQRIDIILTKFNLSRKDLKVVRIRNRNLRLISEELRGFDESKNIHILRDRIFDYCLHRTDDSNIDLMKKRFLRLINKPGILQQLLTMSGDIILSTYGTLVERSYLRDPLVNFDLNIVETAGGITFSTFVLSGKVSNQWMFIGDIDQLSPVTESMYLPKSILRFPDEKELKKAKQFDFQNLRYRKSHRGNYQFHYQMSFSRFLNELGEYQDRNDNPDFKKVYQSFKLLNQYRIHPDLYHKICDVFQLPHEDRTTKKSAGQSFLDLSGFSLFRRKHQRLNYIKSQYKSILEEKLVETFLKLKNEINNHLIQKSHSSITIGITGMNIISIRKVIEKLRLELVKTSTSKFFDSSWIWNNKSIKLTVGSIKFHQESEYDIFLIATWPDYTNQYRERLYTALTRSISYTFVFGPNIQRLSWYRSNIGRNRNLLYKLQR